jgi:hypothetical protein
MGQAHHLPQAFPDLPLATIDLRAEQVAVLVHDNEVVRLGNDGGITTALATCCFPHICGSERNPK